MRCPCRLERQACLAWGKLSPLPPSADFKVVNQPHEPEAEARLATEDSAADARYRRTVFRLCSDGFLPRVPLWESLPTLPCLPLLLRLCGLIFGRLAASGLSGRHQGALLNAQQIQDILRLSIFV